MSALGLALLAIIAAGAPAAGPAQQILEEAGRVRTAGRTTEAVAMLLTAAERHPADSFADDCLAEAARWLADDLHDPVRSVAIWKRLLLKHPGSRHARRANRQVERLEALGLEAAPAARQLLRIQRDPGLSPGKRRSELLVLKKDNPGWAGIARVDAMLAAIRNAGPEPTPPPGPAIPLALLAGLVAVAGWGRLWRRPVEVLLPIPTEVWFLAPIYVVLAAAALAQPAGAVRQLLSMLAVVGGGTLTWVWVAAAALRRHPACSSAMRFAVPVGAAAFVVGLCVYAVQWQGLSAEVLETFQGGPQR